MKRIFQLLLTLFLFVNVGSCQRLRAPTTGGGSAVPAPTAIPQNPAAPGTIGDLNLWMEGEDLAYSDAGSTLATVDVDNVQQWNGLSPSTFNLRNLTAAERPAYLSGQFLNDRVLRFDATGAVGDEDYLQLGSSTELSYDSTDSFAFGFNVVFPSGNFADSELFGKIQQSGDFRGYAISVTDTGNWGAANPDKVQISLNNDTSPSNRIVLRGNWPFFQDREHSVIVVYDGSETAAGWKVYSDSVIGQTNTVLIDTLSATTINTENFRVGAVFNPAFTNPGENVQFDAIFSHKRAYSQSELESLMDYLQARKTAPAYEPSDSANLHYWVRADFGNFNDLSGTIRANDTELVGYQDDKGPNNNDWASPSNGARPSIQIFDTDADAGYVLSGRPAWDFITGASAGDDANADRWEIAESVMDIERTQALTWWSVFKADSGSLTVNRTLYGKQISTSPFNGPAIGVVRLQPNNEVFFDYLSSNSTRLFSGTTGQIAENTWYTIVFTYDGSSSASGVGGYLNGAIETMRPVTDTLNSTILNNVTPAIGSRNPDGNFFDRTWDGMIAEQGMILRELSGVELDNLNLYLTERYALESPPQIDSSLAYWFRADRTFTDAGCTTATVDTNQIACAKDDSTSGDDVGQTTAGERPIYNTSGINSLPAALFDGTDDNLEIAGGHSIAVTDGATIGCIFEADQVGAPARTLVGKGNAAAESSKGWSFEHRDFIRFFLAESAAPNVYMQCETAAATITVDTPHYVAMRYDGSSDCAGTDFWIDGVSSATSAINDTLTVSDDTLSTAPFHVGAWSDATTSQEFDGHIRECVIFSSALTDAKMDKLNAYLARRSQ